MAYKIPPTPVGVPPGHAFWQNWYEALRNYINEGLTTVQWNNIDFQPSSIADIETRDHNLLTALQGGQPGERYHLTRAQYDWVVAGGGGSTLPIASATVLGGIKVGTGLSIDATSGVLSATNTGSVTAVTGAAPITSTGGATPAIGITPATTAAAGSMSAADKTKLDGLSPGSYLPTSGGTMTGDIDWLQSGGTGSIGILPDPGSPGGSVMDITSVDGIALRAPYLILDSDNPVMTMPGAVVGSPLVVAGIDSLGGALLGYGAAGTPGYSIQDTHNANVIIKAAGTAPPTAWVSLQLTVVLTQPISAGLGTAVFKMDLSNPTIRTGVLEYGLRVNGVDLNRNIVQQIPANYASTVALSVPLANGYVAGDSITLIARVTSNNNNAFSLSMLASPSNLAEFRIESLGSSGIPDAPTDGELYGRRDASWDVIPPGTGQMIGQATVKAIFFNNTTIDEDLTLLTGTNGGSFGPITIGNGFTVTVEPGAVWSIV